MSIARFSDRDRNAYIQGAGRTLSLIYFEGIGMRIVPTEKVIIDATNSKVGDRQNTAALGNSDNRRVA